MRFFVFCFLFAGMISCMAADLVRNGKACADIVISEKADPGIRMAAKDLQKYLKLISGAELKIVSPSASKAKVKICVGESVCTAKAKYKRPAFHTSGYDIWVQGNYVVLNGPATTHTETPHRFENVFHEQGRAQILSSDKTVNKQLQVSAADDCGPMHAVSAFLESLGVRFYAPYADGTIVPKKKNISVPDGRITREAAFARREYQNPSISKTDAEGILWLKRLKSGSSTPRIATFPLALVMRKEWASFDKDGNRIPSVDGCGVPKYLSKSFQKACVESLRKMLNEDTNLKYVMIAPPVSNGVTDYRDLQSFRNYEKYPDPVEVNIRFAFAAELAKELKKTHPDRKLVWSNYKNDSLPAKRFLSVKPDNLIIVPGSVSVHKFSDLKRYESMEKLYKGETSKAEQHEFWNDLEFTKESGSGYWSFYTLQQFRQMQTKYLAGFLMDIPADANNHLAEIPLTHLAIYVNSKLLWDPNLDLKALLDEYYTLWYGPAAEKMRDFQIFAESIAARKGSRSIALKRGKMIPSDVPVWFELLKKAKDRTAPGSIYRRRIEALEASSAWMKTAFQKKTPTGEQIVSEVLPYNVKCNADLRKYKKWISFGKQKTEISVAFTENRTHLLIGFRCYDKNMKRFSAKSKQLKQDSREIFNRDHIAVSFFSSNKGNYTVAADITGSLFNASTDNDEVDFWGTAVGWNPLLTECCVKKYSDRWEGELFINTDGCGLTPDWAPAWGLNVERVSYSGNKKEISSLLPNPLWRALILPQVDSKGRTVNSYRNVLLSLPGIKTEHVYTIHKAKGNVNLSDPWDSASWKNIPELRLGIELFNPKNSSGFRPDARAKIQYDDKYIYVLYKVNDRYVRGDFKDDHDMVCVNSTMEIFFRPNGKGDYFNFEANCIGTLLLYQCTPNENGFSAVPVPVEDLKKIKRFSTLPRNMKGEITKPVTWRMGLQIPVDFFVRYSKVQLPLSRQVWTANVMKCADWTTHPCWLMWHPSVTFHYPDDFGTMIFE